MSTFVFANFFQSTLAAAVTSSQTTIPVASASGVPTIGTGQQWAIVVQSASTQTAREVMYVTAISGTTFTVTRGEEGTTAQSWSIGDNVFGGNTAGQMGALVQQDGAQVYAVDTGTTNALAISLSPAPTAYVAGMTVRVKVANTNTSAATLNVNSLGVVSIVNPDGSGMGAEQLAAGAVVSATYDGTNFRLLGGSAAIEGTTGTFSGTVSAASINLSGYSGISFPDSVQIYEDSTGDGPGDLTVKTYDGTNVHYSVFGKAGDLTVPGQGTFGGTVSGTGGNFSGPVSATGNVTANSGRLRATDAATGTGDINCATLLADFGSSNAGNGYQKLPSGIIIQWGSYVTSTNPSQSITFPITFPSTVFAAFAAEEAASSANWGIGKPDISAVDNGSWSTSGMTIFTLVWDGSAWIGSNGIGIVWLAMGY